MIEPPATDPQQSWRYRAAISTWAAMIRRYILEQQQQLLSGQPNPAIEHGNPATPAQEQGREREHC